MVRIDPPRPPAPRHGFTRLLPDRVRPSAAGLPPLVARLAGLGAVLVLAWPAARGHSDLLGWLPLWLAAMPASAAWVLHGCPVPWVRRAVAPAWLGVGRVAVPPRARRAPQARRRVPRGAVRARAA